MRSFPAFLYGTFFLILVAAAAVAAGPIADVVAIKTSGQTGGYSFSVTIKSPDLGCNQYADWWEILDESGRLIYRRVLVHSHVGEQPFERSGGPVAIQADTVVWVRAHMQPGGYGGTTYKGSVRSGFNPAPVPPKFAAALEKAQPLPDGCAF